MDKKRQRWQSVLACALLFLLLLTFLSYFFLPPLVDARTRRVLGLSEDAVVSDTARTPWVYVDAEGIFSIYPEQTVGLTEMRFPDALNGVLLKRPHHAFSLKVGDLKNVRRIIFPVGFTTEAGMLYFHDWENLDTLVFEEGVTDLSKMYVYKMPSLTSVYLPKSVSALYSKCFTDCHADITVYYAGTEAEWAALPFAKKVAATCRVVCATPYSAEEKK